MVRAALQLEQISNAIALTPSPLIVPPLVLFHNAGGVEIFNHQLDNLPSYSRPFFNELIVTFTHMDTCIYYLV